MDEAAQQIAELNRAVVHWYNQGDYREAAALAAKACSLVRDCLGEDHPEHATSLDNLARLYGLTGRYAEAEPLYRHAMKIWRAALGEDHPDYATSLNNLASLYLSIGRYAEAEPLCRQAMEIRRAVLGEDHPDYATSVNNLAGLYMSMGSYAEAEPLYRHAMEIWRTALGEDHPYYATSLNNLAGLYESMGRYADAEPLYRQAMKIRGTALGEDHSAYAGSVNNLAELYRSMGRNAEAEPLYRHAMEIWRTALGDDHPYYATSLNNLAELFRSMGRFVEAEPLCRQAMKIRGMALGENHPAYAGSLNNLAALCESMGRFVEAEPLYRQAMEIWRTALGDDHPAYALSLNNLAGLCESMGRYAEAEPLYRQAMKVTRVALGEDHPAYAGSLNNLAWLCRSMGRDAEAEPLYRQAMKIWRAALGEDHPDYAGSLNSLATLLAASDRADDALTLLERAARIQDRLIGQMFSVGSEDQRTAYLQTVQGAFDVYLSLVHQRLAGSSTARQAALDLVLRRKAIGAEALAAQRDAVLGGRYPHLGPRLLELNLMRRQITQKTLAGPGHEDPQEYRQRLTDWTARKVRLEAELARQIPEINLEQRLRAASRDAVALHLPAATMLVEFVRFNDFDFHAVPARGERQWKPARYLAFVLTAGRPNHVGMIDLGEAEPIDRMIAGFREQTLSGHGGERTFAADSVRPEQRDFQPEGARAERVLAPVAGRDLRGLVFDPLISALDDAKRLLISPDGALTRLAFEVLPTDEGTYLADRYRISYLASGRDVLRTGASPAREPGPALVTADPDFDLGDGVTAHRAALTSADLPLAGRQSRDLDRASLRFSRLPGTRLEGERIAKLLGTEPWLEENALEARLRARRSPRILHMATHGFFLEDLKIDPNQARGAFGISSFELGEERRRLLDQGIENPLLRSGLALAGVNTWLRHGKPPEEAEDGLLTAEDVTGLDLLDTELVVLSACETGLGEVRVGEGVFGLRRAFVLAGAKTLVMSLWKVPDLATAILMVRFYENLLQENMERDDALRAAQRYLRHVTVGEIRQEWLSAEVIAQASAGREETLRELEELAAQPDAHRPFEHPLYWGAFICQGATRPLPSSSPA